MLKASRYGVTSYSCLIALGSLMMLAYLGLIGGPESAAASGSGPVAAYSFDAGEGEVAEDVTGNAHDGEIEGAEWFNNGKFGKALSFDGENDCVTVADAPDLQLTEELTLEAWVKPQGAIPHDPVIYKQQEGYLSYSLQLGWGVDGLAEGYIGEDEENYENVYSPDPLEANVWTHLAFTYDGATLRIFVNGEEVNEGEAPSTALASNGSLLIGCAPGEYFHGLIDEIRIYNRALNAGEIAADGGAGLETPQTPPSPPTPLTRAKAKSPKTSRAMHTTVKSKAPNGLTTASSARPSPSTAKTTASPSPTPPTCS